MSAPIIDVVIPVYRNLDLTQKCVESVLRADDPERGVLYVINDASPEPALAAYCRELADRQSVQLVEHTDNQGFVRSVNAALEHAADRDVVILNSDTEVPAGWLTRLSAAAAQNPKAASITPFSNNATICSYPDFCEDNELPEGLGVKELDALFADANAGQVIQIPTGVGFCMYLRREAIEEVGAFDPEAFGRGYGEENDWCLRASAKGWMHLLAADIFVYHAGGASFREEAGAHQANALQVISERYPDYEKDIARYIEADPIEILRYQVNTVRPDTRAVIDEYRRRERAIRASRYELDRQRHEQVTVLDELLHSTREEAKAEAQRYEALLVSQREDTTKSEAAYQKQLEKMAAGYAVLDEELQALQRFWPVRLRSWLLRRLGRK